MSSLRVEEEQQFLAPFFARARSGEIATATEVKLAFEARGGHEVEERTDHGSTRQSALAGSLDLNGAGHRLAFGLLSLLKSCGSRCMSLPLSRPRSVGLSPWFSLPRTRRP